MIENSLVSGLGGGYARRDRLDALTTSAYASLRDELIDALMLDPARQVRTPGERRAERPAQDAVGEMLGDTELRELLRIVGMCAAGRADHELHLRASAWIAARASQHAAWHADSLAAQMEGNE